MAKSRLRDPQGEARHRALASWIFGGVLLAVILVIFFVAPESLPAYKQPIVPILVALLCGFLAFFLTGTIGIRLSWVKATGGIAVVALVLFVWTRLVPAPSGTFRVRVALLDAAGRPLPDAELRSTLGERKKTDVGWELDIPATSLPADHKVALYAVQPAAFLSGRQTLLLSDAD